MEMPSIPAMTSAASNQAMMPQEAAKMGKLRKLYESEMTEMSIGRLDNSFMVSTHKDEATRLISRFSSTVDTLNQILQKV